MNTRSLIAITMAAVLVAGCTSTRISKKFSAGEIGCDEDSIQIANESASIEGMHNWIAICKGTKYVCSYHTGDGATCKEAKDQNMKLEDIDD
jgi:hypothetical protein